MIWQPPLLLSEPALLHRQTICGWGEARIDLHRKASPMTLASLVLSFAVAIPNHVVDKIRKFFPSLLCSGSPGLQPWCRGTADAGERSGGGAEKREPKEQPERHRWGPSTKVSGEVSLGGRGVGPLGPRQAARRSTPALLAALLVAAAAALAAAWRSVRRRADPGLAGRWAAVSYGGGVPAGGPRWEGSVTRG